MMAACEVLPWKPQQSISPGFSAFLLVLAIVLAGCASTPKVDWNSRVGILTYDQAVLDLGPPDRSSKLEDGTMVADWFHVGSGGGVSVGVGAGVSTLGVYGGPTFSSGESTRVLRLTFGPEGKLAGFKTFSQ
jgi:hypothetical protein